MNTNDFRTKTEMIERNNGIIPGTWECALDAGYSGVKYFSPVSLGRFPSFAKRADEKIQFVGAEPDSAIQYIGDDGSYWAVGDLAYSRLEKGDTSDSESSLYGRERYFSPMWRVITDAGLAFSLMSNSIAKRNADDRIIVQTGLPERYLSDAPELIESLKGEHRFSLKVGRRTWQRFAFNIDENDIYVMSQPKGTLFSVCMDANGKPAKGAGKYLKSSGLVFDPGFGTLDIFPIVNGAVGHGETFADLGMKRILEETSKAIYEKYHELLTVPELQKALENGVIRHANMRTLKSVEYPFADLLEEASIKVCDEAIERLISSVSLSSYNYMIVTGGTGAAWYDHIVDRFKDFSTLKILKGNENDGSMPFVYANCRGYYLYRAGKLRREYNAH